MQNTSEHAPINHFFTTAQLLAFSQPPSNDVLKLVSVGGSQKEKYIPGDYVTMLLNYYIGQGMWARSSEFNFEHTETLTKRRQNKDTKQWEEYQLIVVSASVRTTLTIFARDGSDRTLKYDAICVGTGQNEIKNGKSQALDHAIKSAETDGLKRAAKNLGKAFGLDIKGIIQDKMMPTPLKVIQSGLEQYRAQASLPPEKPVEETPVVHTLTAARATRADIADNMPKVKPDYAREIHDDNRQATTVGATALQIDHQADPSFIAETMNLQPVEVENDYKLAAETEITARTTQTVEPAAHQPQPEVKAEQTVAEQPTSQKASQPAEAWDIGGVVPTNYQDWCAFISTMQSRINRCQLEKEIDTFCERYKKKIGLLPVIPASDTMAERDFKKAWATIVANRREQIRARALASENA